MFFQPILLTVINMHPYLLIIIKTAFFYVLIIAIHHIMGKREIGKLSIVDLIVAILIAEIAALGIEKYDTDVWNFIIPIVLLTIFQVTMAFTSLKNNRFRDFLEGQPVIVVKNGEILAKNMQKIRYNLDDLLMQLREQGVRSVSEVEYAILENNGSLSVFKYNLLKIPTPFPLPVITDGHLVPVTLKEGNKSRVWINNKLRKENLEVDKVFYAYFWGINGCKLKLVKKPTDTDTETK